MVDGHRVLLSAVTVVLTSVFAVQILNFTMSCKYTFWHISGTYLENQGFRYSAARKMSVYEYAFPSVICRDDTDRDVNWMSPVQGESPLVQVKEPYGNFDIVTCRLSSCSPECTKYTCR